MSEQLIETLMRQSKNAAKYASQRRLESERESLTLASMLFDQAAAELTRLQRRVQELEQIVERLPKTADGVPITPGMKLYPRFNPDDEQEAGQLWSRFGFDVQYSTRAAAEAARTQEKTR